MDLVGKHGKARPSGQPSSTARRQGHLQAQARGSGQSIGSSSRGLDRVRAANKRPRPVEHHNRAGYGVGPSSKNKGSFSSAYNVESSAKKPRIEAVRQPSDYSWSSGSSSSEDDEIVVPKQSNRLYPALPDDRDSPPPPLPPALPLAPRPLHSPPSPSLSQQLSSPDSFSSDATPQSPEPPDANKGNGKGIVQLFTSVIGAGLKKIVEAATPRSPLGGQGRHPSLRLKRGSSSSSGIDSGSSPRREHDSIPIAEMEVGDDHDGEQEAAYLLDNSPSEGSSRRRSSNEDGSYDWELLPSDVNVCRKPDGAPWRLGKGGFGEVFKGLKDGVDEVAVKRIRFHSSSRAMIEQFKQEIDMISRLRHRHILQFYGACVQPKCLYMVTELMQKDLFSALRCDPRYQWTGLYGKEVLEGTAAGLHYLHSRRPPIVHRDIKSPNILLMDGLAKIADVGIARTKAASDMTAQRGFTIAWAAPEVVYRKRATEKIDIWSLGVIVWEVVSGKMPHPGVLVMPTHCPLALRNLYSSCVHDDPTKRPSAAEVLTELRKIK